MGVQVPNSKPNSETYTAAAVERLLMVDGSIRAPS